MITSGFARAYFLVNSRASSGSNDGPAALLSDSRYSVWKWIGVGERAVNVERSDSSATTIDGRSRDSPYSSRTVPSLIATITALAFALSLIPLTKIAVRRSAMSTAGRLTVPTVLTKLGSLAAG